MAKNNKKIQNAFLNHADLSDKYSDDLIDLDDSAEEFYGPCKVKTKKRMRFD